MSAASSTSCYCFHTCTLASTADFLDHYVPKEASAAATPLWFRYLQVVYRSERLPQPFSLASFNYVYHRDATWIREHPHVEWPMATCAWRGGLTTPNVNHVGLPGRLNMSLAVAQLRCEAAYCARWQAEALLGGRRVAGLGSAAQRVAHAFLMPGADFATSSGAVLFGHAHSHWAADHKYLEVMRMRTRDERGTAGFEGADGNGCWLFPASGSGIWVNVGRSWRAASERSIVSSTGHNTSFAIAWAAWRAAHDGATLLHAQNHVAKERYPAQAHVMGFDSMQMGAQVFRLRYPHAQVVLTSKECMASPKPIRACLPLPTRSGPSAQQPCSCTDGSTTATLACSSDSLSASHAAGAAPAPAAPPAMSDEPSNSACSSASAVMCLAGQVRSFSSTSPSLAKLLDVIGLGHPSRSESVALLNLQDSGKGGSRRHTLAEIKPALRRVRAASWRLYGSGDVAAAERAARESCWSGAPGHWSHHFAQMWVLATCLRHVVERELACTKKYGLVVRARPDTTLGNATLHAVRRIASLPANALVKPAAWMTTGVGSDRFMVLTRAAALLLARGLSRAFSSVECGTPGAPRWRPDGRACTRGKVPANGTECLLITVLTRGGASVVFEGNLSVRLERFSEPTAARKGRRLSNGGRNDKAARHHKANANTKARAARAAKAKAVSPKRGAENRSKWTPLRARAAHQSRGASKLPVKAAPRAAAVRTTPRAVARAKTKPVTRARPARSLLRIPRNASLAILICGQLRTLPLIVSNVQAALVHLRNESDLFLAIDRSLSRNVKKPSTAKESVVQSVVEQLQPLAVSVIRSSVGQDDSLVRGRGLMERRERERGRAYSWVMRLRPDMAYDRPFPPLHAWPAPARPTLFSDYLGSGENGTRCGSTSWIDPQMLRRHGACVDDTFGYMSRSVAASAYFRHWFWHASCGGTSLLPKIVETRRGNTTSRVSVRPSGADGRLGCIECRLGCAMHAARVQVAALPGVARHRWLVRSRSQARQAKPDAPLQEAPMPMEAVAFDRESGKSERHYRS